jgi:natural product biosynthesis luciferase-like monooxygenase protein
MDFSLFYFANDGTEQTADPYQLLIEGARFADRNGFTAVWTPERHFHPFGGLYPNPSVTSAAIATVTKRVKIRAGSVVAPLHHPLRIAEEWSVVDNLSNGRVGVSFASGWHATDFAFSPASYDDRRALMDQCVEQVRRLWRGEKLEVLDGHGHAQRVGIFPAPIQREIPIWITSSGQIETFRKAGRLGAGLLTHLLGQNPDQLAEKIDAYRCAVAERDANDGWPGHVVLMVHTCLGEREDETKELVRGPMCDYLRSSLGLWLSSQVDGGPPIDPATLRPADIEVLVTRAFDRHYDDGGLLGTVEKVHKLVDRFRAMGVDELACLIDFGVPAAAVLSNLEHLGALRELSESTALVS